MNNEIILVVILKGQSKLADFYPLFTDGEIGSQLWIKCKTFGDQCRQHFIF